MRNWIFLHLKWILAAVFIITLVVTIGSDPIFYAAGVTAALFVLLGGWKYFSVGWDIKRLQEEADDYQKESKEPEAKPILRGKNGGSIDNYPDEVISSKIDALFRDR